MNYTHKNKLLRGAFPGNKPLLVKPIMVQLNSNGSLHVIMNDNEGKEVWA